MPTGSNRMQFNTASGPIEINFPEMGGTFGEPDVHGFDMTASTVQEAIDSPTREDVDRVTYRIQSIYNTGSEGEKRALEMLLRRAAGP